MPRPRQSSLTLDMLLLSLLNRVCLSGYDVASLLKEPIPLIWPVKHSQIYPALAELETRGDIAGEWMEQRGRPSKKNYRVTDQGRQRLIAWLSEPRGSLTQEEAILVAYNYKLVGADAAVAAIRIYRRQAEKEMSQLEERWTKYAGSFEKSGGPLGPRAPFELALATRRGRIAWCDWFVAQIAADRSLPRGATKRGKRATS